MGFRVYRPLNGVLLHELLFSKRHPFPNEGMRSENQVRKSDFDPAISSTRFCSRASRTCTCVMTTVLPFTSGLACTCHALVAALIMGIQSWDRVKGTKATGVMERIRVSLGAIFSITVRCCGAWTGPSGMTSRPPTLSCISGGNGRAFEVRSERYRWVTFR